jgi:hypothetical protein
LSAIVAVAAGGEPVGAARVACAATLAGRKLAASARSFRASSARCVWQIPQTVRRKQLKGSFTVSTANGTTSRRFAGTVR